MAGSWRTWSGWLGTALAVCLFAGAPIAQDRGPQGRGPQERVMGGVGITIFAEPNFEGLNANFRTDVPDLRKYNMHDRVDSLRIARGEMWEVCENINYKGRCQVFTGDEADLGRRSWGGMISSFRRVRDTGRGGGGFQPPGPPQGFRPRLILFDDVGFRGRAFVVNDVTPRLGSFGDRARSAKVYGGAWELCDGDRFRGRCQTITDSVGDLGRIGLRDRISSARPVGRDR